MPIYSHLEVYADANTFFADIRRANPTTLKPKGRPRMNKIDQLRRDAAHQLAIAMLTHTAPQHQKCRDKALLASVEASAAYTTELHKLNQTPPARKSTDARP